MLRVPLTHLKFDCWSSPKAVIEPSLKIGGFKEGSRSKRHLEQYNLEPRNPKPENHVDHVQ